MTKEMISPSFQEYELEGSEIEKWRTDKKLSQQQLANHLGVTACKHKSKDPQTSLF